VKKFPLTFIEMFSGIGGFRLGLERAGWKCVWANDWDKYANKIYKKHFGSKELVEGDIRKVDAKEIPNHTLLTAGFPCQAFSVAGKRQGFEDTRGTLFFDIARVASVKRPPLLLLENVKGLLSCQKGYTFARILQTLDELGYDVEWQVLNSKYFGVPQNRERVFIIGHLRGTGSRKIFPIGKESEESPRKNQIVKVGNIFPSKHEAGDILHPKGISPTLRPMGPRGSSKVQAPKIAYCIDANYWKGTTLEGFLKKKRRQLICVVDAGRSYRVYDPNGVSPTLPTSCGGLHEPKVVIVADRSRRYAGKGRQLEAPKTVTKALSSVQKDDLVLLRNVKIRRLTPKECERLQGFPDGWTEGVSDTQRYKLLGNAVTVNVVEFLGKKLKWALGYD